MRFLFLAALLIAAGVSTFVLSQPENTEDRKFEKFMDDYLEKLWQRAPFLATMSGIHKYDDRIQTFSLQEAQSSLDENKKLAERLQKEIDRSKLSEQNRIDYDLLIMSVKQEEFQLKQGRGLERNPEIYPEILAGVGFVMFSREYAPLAERMKNLATRMEKMPQTLEQAKKNVQNPPKLWTNIAIETAKGAIQMYENVIGPGAKQLPEGSPVRAQFESANAKLVAALHTYQDFLQQNLLQRSNGSFADGRENFVYRLKNFYLLGQSPEEIKAIAEKVLKDTKAEMDAVAKKLDPSRPWWEILEQAKKKHFSAEEVLPEYRKTTERARRWVIEKKLATIPEEKLDVIETPPFMRYVVPYAAYFPPAPFEKEQKGFYFVTPLEADISAEEREGRLGELTIDIENTTVHEAYPGHHLQFIHQNKLSRFRRLNDTPLMSEGWGLYCERLGEEYGFYSTPIDGLQAYRWLLVRAVRVMVDVGMHCQGMDYETAVNLMVEHTKIQRSAAEGEVRRYTQTPTQPLSYLMGMLMIQQLRDQMRQKQGDAFDVQKFHDRVLDYGSIPLKMIHDSMQ